MSVDGAEGLKLGLGPVYMQPQFLGLFVKYKQGFFQRVKYIYEDNDIIFVVKVCNELAGVVIVHT